MNDKQRPKTEKERLYEANKQVLSDQLNELSASLIKLGIAIFEALVWIPAILIKDTLVPATVYTLNPRHWQFWFMLLAIVVYALGVFK